MAGQSFDDRDGLIWMNGTMVPWREAQVHVLNHALHYAGAAFEGERVYNGTIFKLEEHTDRLITSAEQVGMEVPYTAAEINDACRTLVAAGGLMDAYVRPILWRGSEMMGISAQQNRINLSIAAWEWPSYFDPAQKMKGIRLKTGPWRRPAPDTAPVHAKVSGLYMICTMSKHQVEREGYHDALMLDYRGFVAESTGANIFFLIDGALHTPTPDCFLDGITRRTVIALARAEGIEVVERHIRPEEIARASEVFLTGTAAEVTPVGEIDGQAFTPGRVCETLMRAFNDHVRQPVAVAAE